MRYFFLKEKVSKKNFSSLRKGHFARRRRPVTGPALERPLKRTVGASAPAVPLFQS